MRATITPSQFKSKELEEEDFSADELDVLLTHVEVGPKDGNAIIPALLNPCPERCRKAGQRNKKGEPLDCGGNHPHRLKDNVRALTAFCADIDDVTEARMGEVVEGIIQKGTECYGWPTHSHNAEAVARGEAKGRYRILIPFAKPLEIASAAQWTDGAWPKLVKHFGLENVPGVAACSDPGRLYYLPRRPEGSEQREGEYFPGAPLDVHAVVGDLSEPVQVAAAPIVSEEEDPSRPVDIEALKKELVATRNEQLRDIAQRIVRGDMVTSLPGPDGRADGSLDRHNAWWLALGRLSTVAAPWMATDALLEIVRPSHTRERELSPNDFTPWDDDRDSIVHMLAMQRVTAPAYKAKKKAERERQQQIAREGLEKVMLKKEVRIAEDDDEEAPAELTVSEFVECLEMNGNRYAGSLQNISLVFTQAPGWAGAFRHNMLSDEYELWPCAARGNVKVERFSKNLLTTLRLLLSKNADYPIKATAEEVRYAAEWAAHQNAYHPVQDYLNGVSWDAESRLETWLIKYLNAKPIAEDGTDLRQYLASIGKRWLISAVARAFEPGCQVDSILQIEGAQGIRKSSALKVLGGDWYMESTTDFEHKDTLTMLATAWIVELAELASFSRASENAQKNFLSKRVDSIVKKYESYKTELPRRCVLAGTTNQEEYLTDATGNRRHWAFRCEGIIDTDELARDRDQLWAEAVELYRAGERWHLTKEETVIANREADKRMRSDIYDDLIVRWLLSKDPESRPRGVLPSDISTDVLEDKRGAVGKLKITAALKRLGFVKKTMRFGSAVAMRWATPEHLLSAPKEGAVQKAALQSMKEKEARA